jgi:hypothetical protein
MQCNIPYTVLFTHIISPLYPEFLNVECAVGKVQYAEDFENNVNILVTIDRLI